ncbi:TonB-dependent receptor [Parahaliea mediterranea]|uniref:TonB-dependent receptor n=1 Tax=Parahaliea mediterranea TaxID=651086 RepID=A0A939DBC9_9GAMM|nr:TonB-dependent receptor [Parahaliea mediterranea]MBN7795035.1 TonB-dependent receptor [Parahaliea mediterranea]
MRYPPAIGRPLSLTVAALLGTYLPQTSAATENVAMLEEVVVTARRKTEDLQATPVAVSAFGAEAIEQRSIRNIEDIGPLVPNVSIAPDAQAGSAAANIYIRGVGQQDFRIFTDPAVTMYVDGVLIPRAVGGLLNVLDVERIEVLKGPQGTLFGKNTVAGAIKLDSKRPAEQFEGSAYTTMGEDQRLDVGGSVSLPLSDQLFSKVALTRRSSDGWGQAKPLAPEFGAQPASSKRADEDLRAGLVQLDWRGDRVEARWSFDTTRSRSNGSPRHPFVPQPSLNPVNLAGFYNAVVQSAGLPLPLADAAGVPGDPYTTASTFGETANLDVWGSGLTLMWDIGEIGVKSITSYRSLENEIGIDLDGLQARIFDQFEENEQTQWGQELQLSGSAFDTRLDWVAGVFYFSEDGERDVTSQRLGSLLDLGLAAVVPALSTDFRRNMVTELESESSAVFGQGTFRITDRLSTTAGLRWSKEEKTLSGVQTFASGFPDERVVATGRNSDTWTSLTPRLSLEFQWHDDLMTYVSAAQGYKSGGFNGRLNPLLPNGGIQPYEPEEVWTAELGMRSEWWDQRLRLNATLFQSEYSDIQTETTQVIGGDVVNTVGNAAEAEIRGLEIDLLAQLTPSLRIDASLGYLDAEYTQIGETAVDIDEQTVFPRTPDWSATLGLEYAFNLAGGHDINTRIDLSYQGDTYSAINPADEPLADLKLDGYTLVNARVDYLTPGDWKFSAYVKNLTDKTYRVNADFLTSGLGVGYEIYGAPRQAGVSIKKYF